MKLGRPETKSEGNDNLSTEHCPKCGLRGEHECLPDIETVAQNRKPDHADPSAKFRVRGEG